MTGRLTLLAAILSLATVAKTAPAQDVPPPPPESLGTVANDASSGRAGYDVKWDTEKRDNVFIGHYGEVLHFWRDWAAEAVMRGPVEVAYFHEKPQSKVRDWPSEIVRDNESKRVIFREPPYIIDTKEYVPGNFTRRRLMQLLVIPMDVPGGYRSLPELKTAKEAELSRSGMGYTMGPSWGWWEMRDAFWVHISTPYRLNQYYSQSDKHLFILTTGDDPDDKLMTNAAEQLLSSLGAYLDQFKRGLEGSDLLHDSRIMLLPWAVVFLPAAMLAFLPRRHGWTGRLSLMARATLLFTGAWPFYGWPVLYAGCRLGLRRWVNEGSILILSALLMPWVFQALSRRLRGAKSGRVFWWSAGLCALAVLAGIGIALPYLDGAENIDGAGSFWQMSCWHGVLGVLGGIVFGAAHTEPEPGAVSEKRS